VAFPQEGIVRDPGAAELLDEAMKEGCDIVGGLPWYEYTDAEAREHIDICFDIAKRYDRDIHMLVDDTDDENSRSLEYLALKTMRENFHGRVAASHCGAMAAYNDVYAAKIVDLVATAGVTISVNAHINLVCSARLDREPRRRGIARVKELLIRGANVVNVFRRPVETCRRNDARLLRQGFQPHRDIRSPGSGLVAFTGRKLPIVLLPYEDCHLPNIIGPRQSTKRSRFRRGCAEGWLHPGRRRPVHRLSEHREGGARCRRGESGRRTLILRE
jgi:hypothetical protein